MEPVQTKRHGSGLQRNPSPLNSRGMSAVVVHQRGGAQLDADVSVAQKAIAALNANDFSRLNLALKVSQFQQLCAGSVLKDNHSQVRTARGANGPLQIDVANATRLKVQRLGQLLQVGDDLRLHGDSEH